MIDRAESGKKDKNYEALDPIPRLFYTPSLANNETVVFPFMFFQFQKTQGF